MPEFIYLLYFTFIGGFGHFLFKRMFKDLNSRRVQFNDNIKVIYIERIENKDEYWYSLEDYDNFLNENYEYEL